MDISAPSWSGDGKVLATNFNFEFNVFERIHDLLERVVGAEQIIDLVCCNFYNILLFRVAGINDFRNLEAVF